MAREESWELESGSWQTMFLIGGQIDCEGSQGQETLEMLQASVVWDLQSVDFLS